MPKKYKEKGVGGNSKLSMVSTVNFWLTLSFILIIGVVLVYFGLWGYKISLDKNKGNLVQRIEELQDQRDFDLENDFVKLKKGIEGFKNILEKRTYSLNILKMLEELTLLQVWYSNFGADLAKLTVNLKIEVADYDVLAKQVLIFEKDPRIKKVNFSEVSLGEISSVNSDLELELDGSFLYE